MYKYKCLDPRSWCPYSYNSEPEPGEGGETDVHERGETKGNYNKTTGQEVKTRRGVYEYCTYERASTAVLVQGRAHRGSLGRLECASQITRSTGQFMLEPQTDRHKTQTYSRRTRRRRRRRRVADNMEPCMHMPPPSCRSPYSPDRAASVGC